MISLVATKKRKSVNLPLRWVDGPRESLLHRTEAGPESSW